MATPIHDFQAQIATHFRQLTLATAYLEIGSQYLVKAPPTASVALKLAHDVTTEPMRLSELLPHSSAVVEGVSELFQMKAVAAWSDLLNHLFAQFISAHLDGTKSFPELKKRTTRIDFSVNSDIGSQVREGLLADFAFEKYADRFRVVNRILNPKSLREDELSTIKKHVLIRNALQHHGSCVYAEMLKELGSSHIEVLDRDGKNTTLAVSDPIRLFVPELDQLKGALFRVTNTWSTHLA
jgi:hypothetical protein